MDPITILLAGLLLLATAARAKPPATEAVGQDKPGVSKGEPGDEPQ